ncbi:MAG: RNA polymerase factor sigma-54 [Phycisphaeraceae bacterium]|nr:RNA polymerase factor sigma-54 [Phycisphaeraceae bacterium]
MRIDAGQHMRIEQRMKLTPRMIQSMEILQLPLVALEERLEQELSNNPTLELREPTDADRQKLREELEQSQRDDREGERELRVDGDPAGSHSGEDFERLNNLAEDYGETWSGNTLESDSYRPSIPRSDGERDAKMDAMANTAARGQSLSEQLQDQWHLFDFESRIMEAGDFLIGLIDADGYLRLSREEILAQSPPGIDAQDIDQALPLLKASLEPPGLGAFDLRECLLLQIQATERQIKASNGRSEAIKTLALERKLVEDHLKDIEVNRLPRIAKVLNVGIDEVQEAIAGLRRFHPRPGRILAGDTPPAIRPDAIVEFDEVNDCYTARLTNDRFTSVMINPRYARMARNPGVDKKTREFISENLRSAKWFLEAIDQRNSTLLRVIAVVLNAQREFFDYGPQHLRPLPMTSVADQLGIHVATVSRAVSEKYLETPRGNFPLRMFFSGGTETESGEAMSWTAVQAKLQEIIDAEDKSNPLNDDELVEKLQAKGIEIARRTVAKYRKQLNIPPARQRKQY